jgi:hypothetical protein
MEKVLSYPRGRVGEYDGVAQTRSWDCGPASAQIILAAQGIDKSEDWLIGQIGTTTAGTNHAGLITPTLNQLLPGSGYVPVWLSNDPPSRAQVEKLWADVKRSIDADRGVILNFESPPNNRPRGTRGSVSPSYSGSNTIYHYVCGMGLAQDADGSRHIWVADPGFSPFGYWCSLEQVAVLIVPHAYAYASTAPLPTPAPTPSPDLSDRLTRLWTEWNALEFGDLTSIGVIVAAAKAGDSRANVVLNKLEQVNPSALQGFINRKAAA